MRNPCSLFWPCIGHEGKQPRPSELLPSRYSAPSLQDQRELLRSQQLKKKMPTLNTPASHYVSDPYLPSAGCTNEELRAISMAELEVNKTNSQLELEPGRRIISPSRAGQERGLATSYFVHKLTDQFNSYAVIMGLVKIYIYDMMLDSWVQRCCSAHRGYLSCYWLFIQSHLNPLPSSFWRRHSSKASPPRVHKMNDAVHSFEKKSVVPGVHMHLNQPIRFSFVIKHLYYVHCIDCISVTCGSAVFEWSPRGFVSMRY